MFVFSEQEQVIFVAAVAVQTLNVTVPKSQGLVICDENGDN